MSYTAIAMSWILYAFFCAVITTIYARIVFRSTVFYPKLHITTWLFLPVIVCIGIIATIQLLREKKYTDAKQGWKVLACNLMGDYE